MDIVTRKEVESMKQFIKVYGTHEMDTGSVIDTLEQAVELLRRVQKNPYIGISNTGLWRNDMNNFLQSFDGNTNTNHDDRGERTGGG